MCHESSGAALNESIGIGKGCVKVEDFEKANGIFILGQNPGTNHPRMMTTLERAKKNGATIVAINPMPEPGLMAVVNPNPQEYRNPLAYAAKMLFNKGTQLSDLWLPVRINGDMSLMYKSAGHCSGTSVQILVRTPNSEIDIPVVQR